MAQIKISELPEAGPLDGTEDVVIVQDALTQRCSTQDIADLAAAPPLPYLSYIISITQSGTADPIVTEHLNTTGATIVWTRAGTGNYIGTSSSPIFSNETFISVRNRFSSFNSTTFLDFYFDRVNDSTIRILTNKAPNGSTTLEDGLLFGEPMEVKIF